MHNRHFDSEWTEYLFTNLWQGCMFSLQWVCVKNITWRHFKSTHVSFDTTFPLGSDARCQRICYEQRRHTLFQACTKQETETGSYVYIVTSPPDFIAIKKKSHFSHLVSRYSLIIEMLSCWSSVLKLFTFIIPHACTDFIIRTMIGTSFGFLCALKS